MPASAAGLGLPGGFGKPDIVLGDRHGQSCAPAITARLEKLFEDQGLVVSRNRPYAGGFITQCHGKPRLGRHAIQIEINRALYMDEESLIPTPGFGKLAECLTRVMDSFLKELPSLLLPQALAAE
jgi:N-formylglutamate amidohydrolase